MRYLVAQADARALPFRDESVQCVVTSPPYFGLRDYQIAGQIGLEPTIDAYVAQLVTVFREVWRCLKPDGVVWCNLGDSYAQSGMGGNPADSPHRKQATNVGSLIPGRKAQAGLKPKDLCMIPARVALALQAEGWYLRSEIVWSKSNPMPESVTDRPTKAHEMIYLLAKSPAYYFDADAVREPHTSPMIARNRHQNGGGSAESLSGNTRQNFGLMEYNQAGRNIRSVWHIATQPYPGAHFATMPEKLIERCILSGSRAGDVVLDPFLGSGTVARVALRLGRRALGSDLNPAYLELADERTTVTYGLPFCENPAV